MDHSNDASSFLIVRYRTVPILCVAQTQSDDINTRSTSTSRIVSDPNEYAGSTYIPKLVLSVMGVSAKTVEIVERLPKLDFETGDPESA